MSLLDWVILGLCIVAIVLLLTWHIEGDNT